MHKNNDLDGGKVLVHTSRIFFEYLIFTLAYVQLVELLKSSGSNRVRDTRAASKGVPSKLKC